MCAQTVREALQTVAGVKKVRVNLRRKEVAIAATSETKIESLIEALKATGYRANPAAAKSYSSS